MGVVGLIERLNVMLKSNKRLHIKFAMFVFHITHLDFAGALNAKIHPFSLASINGNEFTIMRVVAARSNAVKLSSWPSRHDKSRQPESLFPFFGFRSGAGDGRRKRSGALASRSLFPRYNKNKSRFQPVFFRRITGNHRGNNAALLQLRHYLITHGAINSVIYLVSSTSRIRYQAIVCEHVFINALLFICTR